MNQPASYTPYSLPYDPNTQLFDVLRFETYNLYKQESVESLVSVPLYYDIHWPRYPLQLKLRFNVNKIEVFSKIDHDGNSPPTFADKIQKQAERIQAYVLAIMKYTHEGQIKYEPYDANRLNIKLCEFDKNPKTGVHKLDQGYDEIFYYILEPGQRCFRYINAGSQLSAPYLEQLLKGAKSSPVPLVQRALRYLVGAEMESNSESTFFYLDLAVSTYQKKSPCEKKERDRLFLARAMTYLADCFYWGYGTSIQPQKAVDLYNRANSLGCYLAAYRLGVIKLKRGDVNKDDIIPYFQIAATQDYMPAYYYLAICLWDKNPKEAESWLKKACKKDDPQALCLLGIKYLKKKDKAKHGLKALKKAFQLGYAISEIFIEKYKREKFRESDDDVAFLEKLKANHIFYNELFQLCDPQDIEQFFNRNIVFVAQELEAALLYKDRTNLSFLWNTIHTILHKPVEEPNFLEEFLTSSFLPATDLVLKKKFEESRAKNYTIESSLSSEWIRRANISKAFDSFEASFQGIDLRIFDKLAGKTFLELAEEQFQKKLNFILAVAKPKNAKELIVLPASSFLTKKSFIQVSTENQFIYWLSLTSINHKEEFQLIDLTWHAQQASSSLMNQLELHVFQDPNGLALKGQSCEDARDYESAFCYYEIAANKLHAPSLAKLAHFYERGWYVAKDEKRSLELYKQAISLKDPYLCQKLMPILLKKAEGDDDIERQLEIYLLAEQCKKCIEAKFIATEG